MKMLNRRTFLHSAAATAALAGLGGADLWAAGGEALKIGYLPITDATPLLIADSLGYYREEGLTAEPPMKFRSWAAMAESFLTGKCNVTHLLFPIPIWMRYNLKVPVKVLAWNHINGSAITVAGDSAIKNFADLGGKSIAVPFWYSIHNIILQASLRQAGLATVVQHQAVPIGKDETNLFVLPPQEMPGALAGRKIDGYIVAEPYNALGELKMDAKIMRFTGDIWKNHPCCVVVVKEELIARDPAFVQKVVNSLVRAQIWTNANRREAARILSRDGQGYIPVARDVLEQVFLGYDNAVYGGREGSPAAIRNQQWHTNRIGFQPYPYPSATRLLTTEMKETVMEGDTAFLKGLDPDFVARDLVDDRFVKEAITKFGVGGAFDPHDFPGWEREEETDFIPGAARPAKKGMSP